VFGVAYGLLVLRIAPVVPAFGRDDIGHPGVQPDGLRIGAPWTPQHGFHTRLAGNGAVVENQPVRSFLRRIGRRNPSRAQHMNMAALEPGGRLAVDKVSVSVDVALVKILAPAAHTNGVLPAEKATLAKERA